VEIRTYTKKGSLITSQGICATIIKEINTASNGIEEEEEKKNQRITVTTDIDITLAVLPSKLCNFCYQKLLYGKNPKSPSYTIFFYHI
jgi:hypothetical protein